MTSLLLACAGCGASPMAAPDAALGDAGRDAASLADVGPAPIDGGASGGGDITGTVNGTPFDTAATSYVLGAPDDPATTVVYVFSAPVACADLASPGWDTRIPNSTSVLEMRLFGLTPMTYTVVRTVTPGPGEASVNHTLSSTAGTPTELGAHTGTVTLSTVAPMGPATGAFDLMFAGTDSLSGHFSAVFCPGGHEP